MNPLLWTVGFVLVVSFLSNVSPFLGAAYTWLATFQLAALGFSVFNYLLVVILSAVGATLAKVVIYYGAFGFRDYLVRNRNVRLIGRYSSTRRFYLVLFATALLPVFPLDDFIYIGAGATSASLGLMASVTLWAKFIKGLIEIGLEFTILRDLVGLFGVQRLDITALFTAVFLVIGVILYKIDWEGVYRRATKRPPMQGAEMTASA